MIKLRKEYKSMRMLIVEDEKDLCNILKNGCKKTTLSMFVWMAKLLKII